MSEIDDEKLEALREKMLEFGRKRAILSRESDRGCALLAAAYLDDSLGQLFESAFVDPENSGELFRHHGPLSTFSSKTELSYQMGLVNKGVRSDLNLIRKIRNLFAHDARPLSFESPQCADRCRELQHHNLGFGQVPARTLFNRAVSGLLSIIDSTQMKDLKKNTPIPTRIAAPEGREDAVRGLVQSASLLPMVVATHGEEATTTELVMEYMLGIRNKTELRIPTEEEWETHSFSQFFERLEVQLGFPLGDDEE